MSGKHHKEKKEEETTALATKEPGFPAFGESFLGTSPFSLMRRFMDDMDRVFQEFNGPRAPFSIEKAAWTPKLEVTKSNGDLIVKADLPGINREDINLEIGDGVLTLSGERKQESTEEREGFYRSEVSYGSFFRSIPLPKGVTPENATANFENGVLEVKIAVPTVESSSRKIEITEGGKAPNAATAAAS